MNWLKADWMEFSMLIFSPAPATKIYFAVVMVV
jgi:hypothetical protein